MLELAQEWWTPERVAEVVGVSRRTVERRNEELVERGQMPKLKRLIWSRNDAQKLANYIATARLRKKVSHGCRNVVAAP